ncbi:hypothetical protein Alches_16030 [Alicyclobacillus hesperidum subsp. aegles]|uniref:mannosyltransferase family protein n=1 Tax=Alicyclobacillus hesperidum TaxID=89784 RepID=UPI00222DE73E|nr:mannosyltransferase family protein [Alicyclobacillus hesperidum]GLG01564.1 hypothetical protein Alches_16030 [Alicyclobacillus hesperidum subsp. aegles]
MFNSARVRHLATAAAAHYAVIFAGIFAPVGDAASRIHMTGTFADNFIQWDSQWFVDIARYGYLLPLAVQRTFIPTGNVVPFTPAFKGAAFLPGLPVVVRILGPILALVLVNLLFLCALALMYRIVENERPARAFPTVLLFAVGPCAIIFSSLYTESFTLFAVLLIMYGLQNPMSSRRYWIACVGACMATAFHDLGAFAALFAIRLFRLRMPVRGLFFLACLVLVPACYEWYLWSHFHTPFALLTAEDSWHRHWSAPLTNALDAIVGGQFTTITAVTLAVACLVACQAYVALRCDFRLWATPGQGIVCSLETCLWMAAILFLGLCANMPNNPLESVLRFYAILWPASLPVARWPQADRATPAFWLALIGFAATATLGSALFSHGWFFQ